MQPTSQLLPTGPQIPQLQDILNYLISQYQGIYGADINLDSNTPDGQLLNIFAEMIIDVLQFITQIYNSFDPDNAIDTQLDSRVALNLITRKGATYTLQQINITVDQAITLPGLDANADLSSGTGYTVSDNAGNQFILLNTISIITPGIYNLTFRAADLGAITTIPNTITTPVTIVLGVTNLNNTTGALTIGQNYEPDSVLKIRRANSVANNGVASIDSMLGNLLNLINVSDAKVYENDTNITDIYGIPAHSMWAIVEGGNNADIANTIYYIKCPGCGMRGNQSYDIITQSGALKTIYWDVPTGVTLYIKFNIKPLIINATFNTTTIAQYIVNNLNYTIGQPAETSSITSAAINAIASNGGGGVPLDVMISSDDIIYTDYLPTATLDKKWVLDEINIDITVL